MAFLTKTLNWNGAGCRMLRFVKRAGFDLSR
jgi:hypothetical protein